MGQGAHIQKTVLCIKKKAGAFPGLFLRGYPVVTPATCEKWPKSARLWDLLCLEVVIFDTFR